ncbi:acyl-CoA N-acyltransferase [Thozetella sp. PMI_491]|nr:acyl-CoA N-acyltransferase [Thozetella sp. PMI_491]
MESIDIRPATVDDAASIAHVHYQALNTYHEFYAAFFAVHPRDSVPKSTASALQSLGQNFVVAVDTSSGEIVGFIRYHFVDAEKVEEKTVNTVPSLFAPKDHLKDLWAKFCDREDDMDVCYLNASRGKKHNYVKHLMVDPNHQRKGIGKKLLGYVVAKSDADGIPTFLVASAEAHHLYGKLGFEDLGTFRIDNGFWAKEIVQHENELGITGNEGLDERFKDVEEVERYMVRWCR